MTYEQACDLMGPLAGRHIRDESAARAIDVAVREHGDMDGLLPVVDGDFRYTGEVCEATGHRGYMIVADGMAVQVETK